MKKVIALSLLVVFLLNVVGYYGVFIGLQYVNNVDMTRQLDAAAFSESGTFTVRIPLTVAYAPDAEDFVRVTGQFEYQGQYFQMIKQKLTHDTLTVICLRDNHLGNIRHSIITFVKTFTDSPESSGVKTLPSLIKDYFSPTLQIKSACSGWEDQVSKTTRLKVFISSFMPSVVHPPERG